eukprot:jgi/Mesvir1/22343/Mv04360-RA.1
MNEPRWGKGRGPGGVCGRAPVDTRIPKDVKRYAFCVEVVVGHQGDNEVGPSSSSNDSQKKFFLMNFTKELIRDQKDLSAASAVKLLLKKELSCPLLVVCGDFNWGMASAKYLGPKGLRAVFHEKKTIWKNVIPFEENTNYGNNAHYDNFVVERAQHGRVESYNVWGFPTIFKGVRGSENLSNHK